MSSQSQLKFRYVKLMKDEVDEWSLDSKARILRERHAEIMNASLKNNEAWKFYQKMHNNREARKYMKPQKATYANCSTRTVELVKDQHNGDGSQWRKEESKLLFICALGLHPKLSWEGLPQIQIPNHDSSSFCNNKLAQNILTLKLKKTDDVAKNKATSKANANRQNECG